PRRGRRAGCRLPGPGRADRGRRGAPRWSDYPGSAVRRGRRVTRGGSARVVLDPLARERLCELADGAFHVPVRGPAVADGQDAVAPQLDRSGRFAFAEERVVRGASQHDEGIADGDVRVDVGRPREQHLHVQGGSMGGSWRASSHVTTLTPTALSRPAMRFRKSRSSRTGGSGSLSWRWIETVSFVTPASGRWTRAIAGSPRPAQRTDAMRNAAVFVGISHRSRPAAVTRKGANGGRQRF